MSGKERFIEIYQAHIRRPGSQRLLEYLQSPASDFFEAPASTRFHGAYKGGLVDHSTNVYHWLNDYVRRNAYAGHLAPVPPVLRAKLGNDAGLIGAACLVEGAAGAADIG